MFGFLIKKTFFDMWDNLLIVLFSNVGFIALLAGVFSLLALITNLALLITIGIIILFIVNWYFATVSHLMSKIADFERPEWRDYPKFFKQSLPFALLSTLISGFIISVIASMFLWNVLLGNMIGIAAGSLLFWITLSVVLSLQYFYPVITRLDKNPKKIIRKCFVLFFDNTLFTIGLFLTSLIILALSGVLALMVPGIATILLLQQVALRTRLYKYDYMEENPEANRKKIPWKALLIEDNEKIGPRTLKGLIFPWKD